MSPFADWTTMTPEQRDTIVHALGMTPLGRRMRRWSYRNYYCECEPPEDKIVEMCKAGWLRPGRTINDGTARYYYVTKEGAYAAGVLNRCRLRDIQQ